MLESVLPTSASFISLATAGVGCILTIPPVYLIERVGRRPLFTFSCLGMVAGNLLLSWSLSSGQATLSVIGIFLTVAAFSFGLGPLPFMCATYSDGLTAQLCQRMPTGARCRFSRLDRSCVRPDLAQLTSQRELDLHHSRRHRVQSTTRATRSSRFPGLRRRDRSSAHCHSHTVSLTDCTRCLLYIRAS